MNEGIDVYSKTAGHDEKVLSNLSKEIKEFHNSIHLIKGTIPFVNSVVIEGEEKIINSGIKELFQIISESKKQARKGDSPTILKELCFTATNCIETGIINLSKINSDINTIDRIKIKFQKAQSDILTFGNNRKLINAIANIETISFIGGIFLIKNQVKKLCALCPQKFNLLEVFSDEKLKKEEKAYIATILLPKLEEAVKTVNTINDEKEKEKLISLTNKTKEKADKMSKLVDLQKLKKSPVETTGEPEPVVTSGDVMKESTDIVKESFNEVGAIIGNTMSDTTNQIKEGTDGAINQTKDALKNAFGGISLNSSFKNPFKK